MTLIIEDGSIVAGAESYTTILEFKSYCDSRGVLYPTADSELEKIARKAFDYLQRKYRSSWKGTKKTVTQISDWPRTGVYIDSFNDQSTNQSYLIPDNVIPLDVKIAQVELMIRGQASDLLPDTGSRVEKSIKIGPITVDYGDSASGVGGSLPVYTTVDSILAIYLVTTAQNSNTGISTSQVYRA